MSNSAGPKITKDGLVLDFDAANYKSYPAAQDTYVNNVSLMLDGESLTDKSQNNFTVTNSSVAVSSAQVKYGTSSLYFNGASYLSIPDSTAFGFGTGDFTIEFWLKLGAAITATSGDASYRSIVNKYSAGSTGTEDAFYVFLNNAAGTMQFNVGFVSNTTASNFAFNITGVDTSLNSVWNHVAVVRSSGSLKVYFNGTQIGTTQAYSSSINQGTLPLLVGARTYAPIDLYFNGYIDDLRITKSARYTANFTPPTAPLSLPGRITDLTTNKVIGTLTNGPTYSAGAITTDGVNDYINCGNYANANFGTSNFTINMWIKTTSTAGGTILAKSTGDSANASYGWLVYLNATSSGEIGFATATAAGAFSASGNYIIRTSGASVNNGTWKMITVVADRTLANVSIYINGALQTLTTWLTATASLATVGNITNSQILCIGNESDFNVPANAAFSAVQLYNKALTVSEVLQNYNAIKSRYGY